MPWGPQHILPGASRTPCFRIRSQPSTLGGLWFSRSTCGQNAVESHVASILGILVGTASFLLPTCPSGSYLSPGPFSTHTGAQPEGPRGPRSQAHSQREGREVLCPARVSSEAGVEGEQARPVFTSSGQLPPYSRQP